MSVQNPVPSDGNVGGPQQGANVSQNRSASDQVTQLLQSFGLDASSNETLNPLLRQQRIEEAIQENPDLISELLQILEDKGVANPQKQAKKEIEEYLKNNNLPTNPETIREAVAANIQGQIQVSSGNRLNELESILQNLNTASSRVTTANSPTLPASTSTDPSQAASSALANPWLEPNLKATLFLVILEVVFIQAQNRLDEGLRQADLVLQNFDTALERSELTLQQGQLEAQRQFAQAIANIATAAITIAVSIGTLASPALARKSVKNDVNKLEQNPNYRNPETGQPDPTKVRQGLEKYDQQVQKVNDLELRSQNTNLSRFERTKAKGELIVARGKLKDLTPGHKDLQAVKDENGIPEQGQKQEPLSNPQHEKLLESQKKQHETLSDPQTLEGRITAETQRYTQTLAAVRDSVQSVNQAAQGFIGANFEERIARVRAVLVIFDEFQQTLSRAYQTAQSSKDEFANLVQQFTNFLNQVVQAYTGVFGFQGGRVV